MKLIKTIWRILRGSKPPGPYSRTELREMNDDQPGEFHQLEVPIAQMLTTVQRGKNVRTPVLKANACYHPTARGQWWSHPTGTPHDRSEED